METKTCQNPWCGKEFHSNKKRQKYCSMECAEFVHNKQKRKALERKVRKCENPKCNREHDGSYGSGRFCSKECKVEYIASKNRNAHNPKVKAHLDKVRAEGKSAKPNAPYGTWCCKYCGIIFETKTLLREHLSIEHNVCVPSKKVNGFYVCPYCGAKFETSRQMGGHKSSCKKHPLKKEHDEAHVRGGITSAKGYCSGRLINPWKGKHHTLESKQKMRESACRYLMSINPTPCRYNKSSIPILESIAKEHGWNIQHAECGGEFYTGIGHFVDAYDKEKNIVLEYDEPKHYEDVDNNILTKHDLERQTQIIDHLHCEYWRYNEKTKVLWKVM